MGEDGLMTAKRKKLDRAANALLNMRDPDTKVVRTGKRPKPTKRDLERRFRMKLDSKGNPKIVEVD